jgi:hypothetical protein
MTYNEYQELTATTDIRNKTATVNLRLMCSICGILEELEELEDTAWDLSVNEVPNDLNVLSECSDVLWYIASIGIETGITMEELRLRELPVNNKFTNPAKILKKTYRDFNGIMPDMYKQQLWDYLAFILQCILPAYADVEQAMEYNIIKLQNRKANGTIRGEGSRR